MVGPWLIENALLAAMPIPSARCWKVQPAWVCKPRTFEHSELLISVLSRVILRATRWGMKAGEIVLELIGLAIVEEEFCNLLLSITRFPEGDPGIM